MYCLLVKFRISKWKKYDLSLIWDFSITIVVIEVLEVPPLWVYKYIRRVSKSHQVSQLKCGKVSAISSECEACQILFKFSLNEWKIIWARWLVAGWSRDAIVTCGFSCSFFFLRIIQDIWDIFVILVFWDYFKVWWIISDSGEIFWNF